MITEQTNLETGKTDVDFSAKKMREAPSIGLIGACVSRDMREEMFTKAKPHYIWRIATMSLMSAAPTLLDISLPSGAEHERLTLDRDVNKTFSIEKVLNCPYVLIDFFRDMYGCLQLSDGRYITNGLEIRQHSARKLGLDVVDKVDIGDQRFADLWLDSFSRFSELANRSGAQFLITPVYQLAAFSDESGFRVESSWRPKQLVRRNLILGYMQRIALTLLENALMVPLLTETLELDPAHEFGPGPYHYNNAAFARAADVLETTPEYVTTLTASPERRTAIVRQEFESWSTLVASGTIVPPSGQMRLSPPLTLPLPKPYPKQPVIELVLPLRVTGGEHGSDFVRARDGLLPSLNTFCDPGFVTCLTIVVPSADLDTAGELVHNCTLPTRVVAEEEFVPTDRIGPIPRRGWYIQQMVKLAYASMCQSDVYLTLSADMVLINPLSAAVLHDGKPPMTVEPTSAHPGWWRESARLLQQNSVADQFSNTAFGISPTFIYSEIALSLIKELSRLCLKDGHQAWASYLSDQASVREETWTDTSLYWTYLSNTTDPLKHYYPRRIYYYTHYGWKAETFITTPSEKASVMFCILQSSFVDEHSHNRFVKRLAALNSTGDSVGSASNSTTIKHVINY